MPPPLNPRRVWLAARLKEVRASGFPSGMSLANALGWQQSRVSKLETGAQLPTEADIRAIVAAAQAGPVVAAELLELLGLARSERVNARDVQRTGGLAVRQAALGALEAHATDIADWQPGMIPGLVQTAAYACELLLLPGGPRSSVASEDDIEAMVGHRRPRAAPRGGHRAAHGGHRRPDQFAGGAVARRGPPRTAVTGHGDRLPDAPRLPTLDTPMCTATKGPPCVHAVISTSGTSVPNYDGPPRTTYTPPTDQPSRRRPGCFPVFMCLQIPLAILILSYEAWRPPNAFRPLDLLLIVYAVLAQVVGTVWLMAVAFRRAASQALRPDERKGR